MPQPVRRPPRPAPVRRPARAAPRRRPRLRKRRFMRIAGALSLAVLTSSGLGNIAIAGIGAGIGRVDAFRALDNRPPHGSGENFLLVGTDGRERITPQERRGYRLGGAPCHCTDTLMLAHLSQDRSRLSVVSIPRDTSVRLPAAGGLPAGPGKLNSAYSRGGPRLTVRMVERLTGLRVDHYLEVDFAGFMRTVDALGGVPVCTPVPLRDPRSGLDLPAGRTLLDGGRALEYVRARYLDGTADLGRMRRQQRFLAALVRRAAGSGVLLDPDRLRAAVGTALRSVRADPGLGSADLVRLAAALRELTPADSRFASVPLTRLNRRLPGGGTAVTWDRRRAAALFADLRDDRPLPAPAAGRDAHRPSATLVTVAPAAVRVEVTGADRDAVRRTAAALRGTGFALRAPAGSGRGRAAGPGPDGRPVIRYDPRWDRSARSLATALPAARLRAVPRLGGVLRVVLGRAAARVRPVRFSQIAGGADPGGATGGTVSGTEESCP